MHSSERVSHVHGDKSEHVRRIFFFNFNFYCFEKGLEKKLNSLKKSI